MMSPEHASYFQNSAGNKLSVSWQSDVYSNEKYRNSYVTLQNSDVWLELQLSMRSKQTKKPNSEQFLSGSK